jgi:hypothetical protein
MQHNSQAQPTAQTPTGRKTTATERPLKPRRAEQRQPPSNENDNRQQCVGPTKPDRPLKPRQGEQRQPPSKENDNNEQCAGPTKPDRPLKPRRAEQRQPPSKGKRQSTKNKRNNKNHAHAYGRESGICSGQGRHASDDETPKTSETTRTVHTPTADNPAWFEQSRRGSDDEAPKTPETTKTMHTHTDDSPALFGQGRHASDKTKIAATPRPTVRHGSSKADMAATTKHQKQQKQEKQCTLRRPTIRHLFGQGRHASDDEAPKTSETMRTMHTPAVDSPVWFEQSHRDPKNQKQREQCSLRRPTVRHGSSKATATATTKQESIRNSENNALSENRQAGIDGP